MARYAGEVFDSHVSYCILGHLVETSNDTFMSENRTLFIILCGSVM